MTTRNAGVAVAPGLVPQYLDNRNVQQEQIFFRLGLQGIHATAPRMWWIQRMSRSPL
jgi:hypothetical protein